MTGGAALPPPGGGGIIANGIYKIVARHSGKGIEVAGLVTADGSNVQQWGYWGGENEKWMVTHLGNNQYSIIGAQSGKALDVSGWMRTETKSGGSATDVACTGTFCERKLNRLIER